MGSTVRAAEAPPGSSLPSRHLTLPLTVASDLGKRWLAWRSAPTRSHGGSQGFKSPHLHPQTCRSGRRQRRVGGAHCTLRPRCGRKLKPQCSLKALRGQPTQAQASHDDHAAWSPPAASRWAILARIPASPGRPGPVLTTSHDDQVQVDPPLAQHGLRQLRASGSNLGQTTRRHGHGGRPRRPRPSQAVRLPAPATPRNLTLRRTPRRTDTGRRTPGRSDARTGHRSPGQAPSDTGRSHRTLDTGCRTRTRTR
jgi:hypothetical protein